MCMSSITTDSSVELNCKCADTVAIGGIDGNCAPVVTNVSLSNDVADRSCAYARRGDECPAVVDDDDCNVK